MTKLEKIIAIFLAAILTIGLIMIINAASAEEETTSMWVICNPEDRLNIRMYPTTHSKITGYIDCGDEIFLDGKKQGGWVHIIHARTDMDEGWVYRGYITDEPVTIATQECEVNVKQLRVRKCIGGKIIKTIKRGTTVTVYAATSEWAYTDKGYIKTEFLTETEGSTEQ